MACDSPYYTTMANMQKVPVPCGRCPPCRKTRINQWVFRLQQEDKIAVSQSRSVARN